VDADLAKVLAEAGREADAIDAARRALAALRGGLSRGIKPLKLLAILLRSRDEDLADQHLQLARWIRVAEGWPPDDDLEAMAKERERDLPDACPDLGPFRRYWGSAEDLDRCAGEIGWLLPGEGSGFLREDDGEERYFAMPQSCPAPPPGTRVTFRLVDGYDKRKQRPSRKAVDVLVEARRA
jgi:hypothetical protein